MERVPVMSSNVTSVGYDAEKRVLEIEFTGNNVYQYAEVSPEKHRELMASPSIGRFIHQHIKTGHTVSKIERTETDGTETAAA